MKVSSKKKYILQFYMQKPKNCQNKKMLIHIKIPGRNRLEYISNVSLTF